MIVSLDLIWLATIILLAIVLAGYLLHRHIENLDLDHFYGIESDEHSDTGNAKG